MAELPQWHLKGDWFDVCKCDIPCPCEFGQAPSTGDCEGVLVWHVREGHFGEVPLAGFTVLALGSFEGNLWTSEASNLKFAFFVDERANEQQRHALLTIIGGQAGGAPAQLGAIWGHPNVVGMETAPISFELADDLSHWSAEVPGKVRARAEALTGPTTPAGKRVQTLNPPGAETGPGGVATWGKATADWADALGFRFDWAGQSSKHIPFEWSGPT